MDDQVEEEREEGEGGGLYIDRVVRMAACSRSFTGFRAGSKGSVKQVC